MSRKAALLGALLVLAGSGAASGREIEITGRVAAEDGGLAGTTVELRPLLTLHEARNGRQAGAEPAPRSTDV